MVGYRNVNCPDVYHGRALEQLCLAFEKERRTLFMCYAQRLPKSHALDNEVLAESENNFPVYC